MHGNKCTPHTSPKMHAKQLPDISVVKRHAARAKEVSMASCTPPESGPFSMIQNSSYAMYPHSIYIYIYIYIYICIQVSIYIYIYIYIYILYIYIIHQQKCTWIFKQAAFQPVSIQSNSVDRFFLGCPRYVFLPKVDCILDKVIMIPPK